MVLTWVLDLSYISLPTPWQPNDLHTNQIDSLPWAKRRSIITFAFNRPCNRLIIIYTSPTFNTYNVQHKICSLHPILGTDCYYNSLWNFICILSFWYDCLQSLTDKQTASIFLNCTQGKSCSCPFKMIQLWLWSVWSHLTPKWNEHACWDGWHNPPWTNKKKKPKTLINGWFGLQKNI